ncbi:MAG: hypothetical protein KGR98_13040, partial [Verrucomicrobia bacterium]|nr:hypothetical protein [Verrucomicrobiota bacterium]
DRVAILQNGELKRVGTLRQLSAAKSSKLIVDILPAPVMEALAATTAEVTMVQGKIAIRCADEALRHTVEALLQQHGVGIFQRETEAQSLEEIFFSSITPPPKL